MALVVTWSMV